MIKRIETPLKIDEQEKASKLPSVPHHYSVLFKREDVSVGLYAPDKVDPQGPHDRDEIYIVSSGSGQFRCDGEVAEVQRGDFLFAAAGAAHRFEQFSADFRVWVIFFGPQRT